MRYPSGRVATTCYDSAGEAKELKGFRNQTLTYARVDQWHPDGQPKEVTFYSKDLNPNPLTMTTQLNTRMQWSSREVKRLNSTVLLTLGWSYRGNGNVSTHDVTATGVGGVSVRNTYDYDRMNRLASVGEGPINGSVVQSRTQDCDEVGNCWVNPNSAYPLDPFTPTAPNSFTSANRLLSAGYDLTGNQLSMGGNGFGYDAENRQRWQEINGQRWVNYYDGEGRRVMWQYLVLPSSFAVPTVYAYDAGGQLAAEYTAGPYAAPCQTCYRFSDNLGSTRMVAEHVDVKNAQDVVVGTAVVVKALRDYLPYGEENRTNGRGALYTASMGNALGFTGQVRDRLLNGERTGLDYFGARYMSAAQGRFTSPDPLLSSGRPWDPQSWNRYSYVLNNPLRYPIRWDCTYGMAAWVAIHLTMKFERTMPRNRPIKSLAVGTIFAELSQLEQGSMTRESGRRSGRTGPKAKQTAWL
jgi:RHS repeat-associated protein